MTVPKLYSKKFVCLETERLIKAVFLHNTPSLETQPSGLGRDSLRTRHQYVELLPFLLLLQKKKKKERR